MELIYLIIFMCTISGVLCSDGSCFLGLLLSVLTIIVMFIIIVCLSVALYMARNNRSIFGVTINKHPAYLRQESALGVTLCNVTSNNNINEQGRDDGSTLTVNSGIVEIGGLTEPETPTPTHTDENKMSYIIKKPKGPIPPTMQKAQMDKIIEDVLLNRKQKSDSATFRDLNALTKPKAVTKFDNEFMVRRNSASLNQLDALATDETDEGLYMNREAINEIKSKLLPAVKDKAKNEVQNKVTNFSKVQCLKQSLSFNSLHSRHQGDEDEHEVYDTLPNPVRCTSGEVSDDYVEQLHVYDMPPRRNEQSQNKNIVKDPDSNYLLPISKRIQDNEEHSYYANANIKN